MRQFKLVILGLSITSSWGNGHATTYRALLQAAAARGHSVLFLERDVPWYAAHRDLPDPGFCEVGLYGSLDELRDRFGGSVAEAGAVIVGSYVPEGVAVGDWVNSVARGITAFYDIDTPVTLAKLERGDYEYLHPSQIPRYDLYLSFTGGPILEKLESRYDAPLARALYCAVDLEQYYPEAQPMAYDLGYMGTYSPDRQPLLERLLIEPARQWPAGRFWVAGPQYPGDIAWPTAVTRSEHLPPAEHRRFYNSQRFTLNLTRTAMVAAGFAPSVRLFEAAACATPIISDYWDGLETFFEPGREILLAATPVDVLDCLRSLPDSERRAVGERARARVLGAHSAAHRAVELEGYLAQARERQTRRRSG